MYVPFVVATGTMFDNTKIKNVTVTNGKVVDNGNKTLVAALSCPGLVESLGLEDDVDIDLNKIEISKRLYYLNLIDAELNTQRTMIKIMFKSRWIDEKKYKVSMELLYEIGKIVGGLIKFYAKNNKKSV